MLSARDKSSALDLLYSTGEERLTSFSQSLQAQEPEQEPLEHDGQEVHSLSDLMLVYPCGIEKA